MAFACYSKGRKVGKKTERNERTKKDRSTKGSLENRKENLEKMVVKKGEKKSVLRSTVYLLYDIYVDFS